MKLTLEIWRQAGPDTDGNFETVQVDDAVEQMSILELLDHVNNNYVEAGKEPFTFASDCREGICGTCGVTVNGRPHGAGQNTPRACSVCSTTRTATRCASSRSARARSR